MSYCSCGRLNDTSSVEGYLIARYNEKGEIIYAVCIHGSVVINNENEESEIS